MVSIRLSRVGKKNHASFRFVVSDKRKDTIGPALEMLGWYDPHANPTKIEVKADRVQYWLSKGAQPSATVHNLLVGAGVIKGEKVVKAHAKKPKVEPAAPVKKEAVKVEAKAEEKKVEAPAPEVKAEAPKAEAKVVEPKVEAPKVEEKAAEAPTPEVKAEEKKEEVKT
ncbi:MAG: 30S ribosomal protein S16 [Patescibacteria group bacterium]